MVGGTESIVWEETEDRARALVAKAVKDKLGYVPFDVISAVRAPEYDNQCPHGANTTGIRWHFTK